MSLPKFFNRLRTPADMRELDKLEDQRAAMAEVLGVASVKPEVIPFGPYTTGADAQILPFPAPANGGETTGDTETPATLQD